MYIYIYMYISAPLKGGRRHQGVSPFYKQFEYALTNQTQTSQSRQPPFVDDFMSMDPGSSNLLWWLCGNFERETTNSEHIKKSDGADFGGLLGDTTLNHCIFSDSLFFCFRAISFPNRNDIWWCQFECWSNFCAVMSPKRIFMFFPKTSTKISQDVHI